jgi:hypothetical protein
LRLHEALKSIRSNQSKALNWPVFPAAVIGGLASGALAQLLGQTGSWFAERHAIAYLGWSTAVWVSLGFLLAWPAARGRSVGCGTIWAGATMSLYLFAWLFAYCGVFGLCDPSGFWMLWRNERPFEIAAIPVSAVIGLIAAGAWRPGRLGSACLAAPLVWSVPEILQSLRPELLFGPVYGPPRWQYALALGLPTLLVALIPMARARRRIDWLVFVATVVTGGALVYFGLRLFDRNLF